MTYQATDEIYGPGAYRLDFPSSNAEPVRQTLAALAPIVGVTRERDDGEHKTVWVEVGDGGDVWIMAEDIAQMGPWQLVAEGEAGSATGPAASEGEFEPYTPPEVDHAAMVPTAPDGSGKSAVAGVLLGGVILAAIVLGRKKKAA